jgi:hypothetical protein
LQLPQSAATQSKGTGSLFLRRKVASYATEDFGAIGRSLCLQVAKCKGAISIGDRNKAPVGGEVDERATQFPS